MNFVIYCFLRALSWCVNLIPPAAAERIARAAGLLMYFLMPFRRRVARKNLALAYGANLPKQERERIARGAFQHIAVSFMEAFRIGKVLDGDMKPAFDVRGIENLQSALARRRGVIFIVSHLGSWEYLSFLFYLTGYPCLVLVKEIRNPWISKWLESMRLETTVRMIGKENPRAALKAMLGELQNNGIVAVLMDQWAGNNEPWVDFFAVPASTTSIPARLALRSGCALVSGSCIRTAPGRYQIRVYPEMTVNPDTDDELSITARLNRALEDQVREHPEQWIWTHKRWKGPKDRS